MKLQLHALDQRLFVQEAQLPPLAWAEVWSPNPKLQLSGVPSWWPNSSLLGRHPSPSFVLSSSSCRDLSLVVVNLDGLFSALANSWFPWSFAGAQPQSGRPVWGISLRCVNLYFSFTRSIYSFHKCLCLFTYFKCEYRHENHVHALQWALSLVRETDLKQ